MSQEAVERAIAGALIRSEVEEQDFKLRFRTSMRAIQLMQLRGVKSEDFVWLNPKVPAIELDNGKAVIPYLISSEDGIRKREDIKELILQLEEQIVEPTISGVRIHIAAKIFPNTVRKANTPHNELQGRDLEEVAAIVTYIYENMPKPRRRSKTVVTN